jgi:hypothetical protein
MPLWARLECQVVNALIRMDTQARLWPGARKSAVYDRVMGLFRRARKNRGKAAAELLTEQARAAGPPGGAAHREVTVEQRPNPDQPGWGHTLGQAIGKAREDRPSQE